MFSGGLRFFLALSAAEQARGRWVHYGACLIPAELRVAELRVARSEHSTSLELARLARGYVAPR